MPYLTQTEKDLVDQNPVYGRGNPGVLNYRITKLLIQWLGREPRYADFDAAVGALECAKLELVRRSLGPYEDKAIKRNGDVYPDYLLPEPVVEVTDEIEASAFSPCYDCETLEACEEEGMCPDVPMPKSERRYI